MLPYSITEDPGVCVWEPNRFSKTITNIKGL